MCGTVTDVSLIMGGVIKGIFPHWLRRSPKTRHKLVFCKRSLGISLDVVLCCVLDAGNLQINLDDFCVLYVTGNCCLLQ